MSDPVIVIGAGFGGLAATCHLTRLGHDVVVLEAAASPGGRAGAVHHDGFRFDTGPTVVTMMELFADTFAAVDGNVEDFCTLTRLDPIYSARFADGSRLAVRADIADMADEIARFSGPAEAEGYRSFVRWTAELYRLEFDHFINRDIRHLGDMVGSARQLLGLAHVGAFRSWFAKIAEFFHDERLRRLFSFQAMYAGLSPLEALGLFAVIAHMDNVQGVYAPHGGVQSLADGLAAAAIKSGVEFRYNTPVVRVETGAKLVVHTADGTALTACAVVANPDLPIVYDELLDLSPPRSLRRGRYSPSCVVWHLAARGELPAGSAHHNIHFAQDWEHAFSELLGQGRPMGDPSRFVTIGSLSDPERGAAGWSRPVRVGTGPQPRRRRRLAAGNPPVDRPDAAMGRNVGISRGRRGTGQRDRSAGVAPSGRSPGHAVQPGPQLLPVGSVPAGPGRSPSPRRRVLRLRYSPGCGHSHGVDLRADRRRARSCPTQNGIGPMRDGPTSGAITLADSYRLCQRLHRQHGTTYYWATRTLPRVKQPHVHALYGLCRYADEIVDDLSSGGPNDEGANAARAERLEQLEALLVDGLQKHRSDHPVLKAVVVTAGAFDLPSEAFQRFFAAMRADLTVTSYATYPDLERYMDGSAAVIGELMLPILEPVDDVAFHGARDLGIAFQLTNFLRDVGEDLDRGRVYFPQDELKEFDVDVHARRVSEAWREFCRFQIARIDDLYRNADDAIRLLPRSSARSIRAARILYSEILRRIELNDFDVFSQRARVPLGHKLAVAARECTRR